MLQSFRNLLDSLSLHPLEENLFEGSNFYIPTNHTYGGLFLAQSILAAAKTTSLYRTPFSVQSFFVRPGNLNQPTFYKVERIRDGAVYSHRLITASQNNKIQFQAFIIFKEPEPSDVLFQTVELKGINFEDAKTDQDVFSGEEANKLTKNWLKYFLELQPFKMLHFQKSLYLGNDLTSSSNELITEHHSAQFIPESVSLFNEFVENEFKKELNNKKNQSKTKASAVAEKFFKTTVNRALLAFLSDQFGFAAAIRQGGISWQTKGASYASLDNIIRFTNEEIDFENPVYFQLMSPFANDSFGVGENYAFSSNKKLLASFGQAGMLRVK